MADIEQKLQAKSVSIKVGTKRLSLVKELTKWKGIDIEVNCKHRYFLNSFFPRIYKMARKKTKLNWKKPL